LFKRCLPQEITLVPMWKTYMFNHGSDFLEKKEKNNISNKKSIRILIWSTMLMIIFSNFSNDSVQIFFGKMPYCIDSFLGFSLHNKKKIIYLEHKNCPIFCVKLYLKFWQIKCCSTICSHSIFCILWFKHQWLSLNVKK